MMKKNHSLLALIPVVFLITGMSSPSDEAVESVQPYAQPAEKKTHSHQTVKTGKGYTKPHAGIMLDYQRPKAMQQGDSISLSLNLLTRSQADSVQVKISHDDGLQLDSPAEYQFATQKGAKKNIVVQVTSLKEGQFYIDLSATLISQGQKQTRSFSIPLTVGDPANFKSSTEAASEAGYTAKPSEGVISMPAVETVK